MSLRVLDTDRRKESLTTLVKKNLLSPDLTIPDQPTSKKELKSDDCLRRQVDVKIQGGNISGVIRLFPFDDAIAPASHETVTILQKKHPRAVDDLTLLSHLTILIIRKSALTNSV